MVTTTLLRDGAAWQGCMMPSVNILVRAAAAVVALASGLVTTVWTSRAVGPESFGYYAVTITIITLGSVLINAGLSTAGSQEVANEPRRAGEIWWTVTVTRLGTAIAVTGGTILLLQIVPIAPVLRSFLLVGALAWVVLPFRSDWLLVAQGRVRATSVNLMVGSLASTLVAILLVRGTADADRIPWILVVPAAVTALGTSLAASRRTRFDRPPNALAAARSHLRKGLLYFRSDASVFIFMSSDRLFLYVFATPAIVGIYEAAYRVIQPLYMVMTVIGESTYLSLSQAFGTDRLRITFRRYVDLMCFATIPLGFFLLAFAPAVISTLYGERYAGAAEYLAILGWVITFGYTSAVAVLPFSAWNRPREYGNSTMFGGVVNVGLNFALIPTYHGVGAAWATVLAKVAVTLAGVRYFRRATDYPLLRDYAEYFAMSAAAFCAGLVASRLLPFPTASGIVVFGLVYVLLVARVRWRPYGLTRGLHRAMPSPPGDTHGSPG